MALDDDIRILGSVGLFESFTPEQLRLLAFGAERLVLRAGRELFREGQSADCGYIVVSGNITLFHDADEGRIAIRPVGPGAMLGEMALIAQTTRLTGALAEEETEVIRISRAIFRRILEEYPEAAASLHAHISKNLLQLIADIEKVAPQLNGND
ncbi:MULTISPECIES: cyclic nucleotide-binding domain-containing protein [Brucella]|jgi:CRP-like cAMP-binding protein|uniref:Cyclic nucleotide-binding domain protein n=2 Tax=Brucella TaxID=234 RepID=A0A1A9FQS0_9HYPH|nr:MULTISPECIES: cyclic nucleotide-binding domain-containing protein [Brucella]EMG55693.1 cyclic nucleotide-binding protein [Ochrobactrum sp. CDB2]MBK0019751.1 cyclic nucleotide-binding domain-containing protein [Ochrobactrum sp. S45]MBK0043509.1 cyclic nucleotide-binding domain-containing protein [Ochrobactrum sp. S46]MBO1024536.1 cyclic nucleotide-binding domain-containing protein [Ochrobactrum sp. SD129]MQP40105.1 cyclic nucleotide-binding domain-containing protein [Ochrobactrum sp. MYb237]